MELCRRVECTGCYACYNACIHNAIEMRINSEGFYEPIIMDVKCINCGLCEKKCPVLHPVVKKKIEQYGYACWSNDKYIRKESTSGGFFSVVASAMLNQGGVVVGAAFDDELQVRHTLISNINDLHKLRGSKYIQSRIDYVYTDVKSYLKKEIPVLFSGTPCQVAGLYNFLGNDYPNLYTIDLICHGVPSVLVFEKYKTWLENKFNDKLIDFKFRDKHKSWMWFNIRAKFSSGVIYIKTTFKDPFMRIFLRNYALRESCYLCQYTNMERMGDITIADFWGFKPQNKQEYDKDEGISLVLLNTEKGETIFEQCKCNLIYFERSAEIISKSQKSFSSPYDKPQNRDVFWRDFNTTDFGNVIKKYGYPLQRTAERWIISEFGKNKLTVLILFLIRGLKKIIRIVGNK